MDGREKFITILGWFIGVFALFVIITSFLGYKLDRNPLSSEMTKQYHDGVSPPELSGLPR
jgi:hypothetical protein